MMKPTLIICPNCGDGQKITDVESGELICAKCGYVIHERVGDIDEDWSMLAKEPASKLRTSPTSLARTGMGLSTVIGRPDRRAGSGLDAAMRSTFDRLRTWDFRIKGHDERSLRRAFTDLDRLRSTLGLSDAIVEKAAYIYRRAQEQGLVRGRTMRAVMGAAIYILFKGKWEFLEPLMILSWQQTQRREILHEYIEYCYESLTLKCL